MQERAITVDNNTRASNPGRVSVQYGVFIRCYPVLTLSCVALLVFLGLMALQNPAAWVGVLIVLALYGLAMVRVKEQFRHGCANPSQVVSHSPELIAVLTDLTTGQGNWPVVKILKHPLSRMAGGRPRVGARLSTVALYQGSGEEGHWDDFFPVAVNCATGDAAAIRRSLESISPIDWLELEEGLQQVPKPYKPGLYRVDLSRLTRQEQALASGLNRLQPTDLCTLLCPADARPAILESLRSLYGFVEVQGEDPTWTAVAAGAGLHLRVIPPHEMAPGIASIADFFSRVPCSYPDRRAWVVQRVQTTQLVIACTGAPRFDRQAGHYHAICRAAQACEGLIFTGSSVIDGYGRVVLNSGGHFDTA